MFLTVLLYFQNTFSVLAGSQSPGLKYVITAWHKTPCPQTLKMDMSAPCKRLGTLQGSSHNHCSALRATELALVSVLQGLGCSLVLIQQQGSLETDSQAGKVFGRSCTPTSCSRLGQLQSQSCVSQVLNISRKGDFTTSVDNLFQLLNQSVFFLL